MFISVIEACLRALKWRRHGAWSDQQPSLACHTQRSIMPPSQAPQPTHTPPRISRTTRNRNNPARVLFDNQMSVIRPHNCGVFARAAGPSHVLHDNTYFKVMYESFKAQALPYIFHWSIGETCTLRGSRKVASAPGLVVAGYIHKRESKASFKTEHSGRSTEQQSHSIAAIILKTGELPKPTLGHKFIG
jgi:hypothetical protein